MLLQIVSSDVLNISEIKLFQFVQKWIVSHKANETGVKVIISQIRLPQIQLVYLVFIVKPSKLFTPEAYVEAMEFHVFPTQFDETQKRFQPRNRKLFNFSHHYDTQGIMYFWDFQVEKST